MQGQELTFMLPLVGYLLGAGGSLFIFIGICLYYIWSNHRKDNDSSHEKIITDLRELRQEIREIKDDITEYIICIGEKLAQISGGSK
jgi:hypothetical protein